MITGLKLLSNEIQFKAKENTSVLYLLFTTNTRKGTEMQNHYTPKGKHLTIDNRRLIERWKNENMSNRKIAGLLGKAPQTINNEVKRGTTLQQVRKGLYKKVYSADYAQTVYQTNRKQSVKKIILTKEMKEKIFVLKLSVRLMAKYLVVKIF